MNSRLRPARPRVVRTGAWGLGRTRAWTALLANVRGCNYVTSSAVNAIDMWQSGSLDLRAVDRELALARAVGLNSVRVFLPYLVWRSEQDHFLRHIDGFLAAAAQNGLSVLPVLFDDVNFAGVDPQLGDQPDPIPGVHNSRWTASLPVAGLEDPGERPWLERYVRETVSAFARDARVLVWDVYNEPGNSGVGDRSDWLVEASFMWARAVEPVQPLTAGEWEGTDARAPGWLMALSDIASFHAYESPSDHALAERLDRVLASRRPVLSTEWLHRGVGNTFQAMLPIFRAARIGWYSWGLVAGRTQTYLPWETSRAFVPAGQWQHDLLQADGEAWDASEIALIREELRRECRRRGRNRARVFSRIVRDAGSRTPGASPGQLTMLP